MCLLALVIIFYREQRPEGLDECLRIGAALLYLVIIPTILGSVSSLLTPDKASCYSTNDKLRRLVAPLANDVGDAITSLVIMPRDSNLGENSSNVVLTPFNKLPLFMQEVVLVSQSESA